ncbi:MAG: alpha/beta fold hydrolase [Burkholderia sp.]
MSDDIHWIDTRAGRLFAQRWAGAAPAAAADTAPIVLLHDSLGSVALWREFPAALSRATGRDVIAYDRLGFGRSEPAAAPLPHDFIHAEARDALPALQQAFGFTRFVVLGHSIGGAMAAACAAAHPAQCEALVTLSAQAFAEDRTLDGIRAARDAFAAPEQFARLARHHGERARWVLDAWVDTWLDPAFAAWTLDATLARIVCPVLALHGDADEYGSPRHPARIVEGAAGPARLVLLPGCGHVPHREAKAEVLAAISALLGTAPR